MPIDTKIEGSPEDIRSMAGWLRDALAASVHDTVTQVYHARGNSETMWEGQAGDAFRARMTSGGAKADELSTSATSAAQSFETYAADLHTAQVGMGRAREIAHSGGLTVTTDEIVEPGPAPTAPAALPTDGSVTSQMVQAHNDAVTAQNIHAHKVAAYTAALDEANRARGIVDNAGNVGRTIWNELSKKKWLHAADFTNVAVGGLAARHASVLRAEHARLMGEARTSVQRYLASGGGAEARFQNSRAYAKFLEADDALRRAGSVGRVIGSKIPAIGLGISAVGIGYDISQGKPPGKAIISGVGGAAAGIAVGALASGPVGWVALGAVGAGIIVGVGLDYGYDALPQGVKDGIENGVKAVGNAMGDAGEAIGSGAKKVWNSIF